MSDRLYGQMTDDEADEVLDLRLATVYVGLYTTMPGDAGGGVEVSGGSYAREAASFAAASGGVATTDAEIEFTQATASWGTVAGWALHTAAEAGDMRYFGRLVAESTLGAADTQFDLTKDGLVMRYTWDTTGTDPGLTATNPTPGDVVIIDGDNFTAANNGRFVVVDSDTNWFEVVNQDGVAEENKTLGATGSITRVTPTTKAIDSTDTLRFAAGELTVRLG